MLEKLFEEDKRGSFEEYRYNLNMAHLTATIADGYAMKADSMLRRINYRLENKMLFGQLIKVLTKLLKRVDNMPDDKRSDAFFTCSDVFSKVADEMANKYISKEDEVKLLSFIKNTFKDGK